VEGGSWMGVDYIKNGEWRMENGDLIKV